MSDMTPAVQASADERAAAEARTQHLETVPPVTADSAEPRLTKHIRFEAGTVHELMEHLKRWVDWRIAGGRPTKPGISPEGVMDEPTRLAAAQRLGLSSRATQAEIEALDPSVVGVMDEHKRLAEAQRLGLTTRATPEEIAAAIEASRNPPAA